MKITLINAASIKNKVFTEKPFWIIQPLGLAVLAGLTPPHVEVQFIDDRIEAIDYDEPRDLVGISAHTFAALRAYQISAEFKKRDVPVILGGFHPTLMPQEALQHADSVLVGEAEGIWEDIVHDAECGRLKRLYQRQTVIPLRDFRLDRSVFAGKGYMPLAMVEATRGCPHTCDFCAVTAFYRHCFRFRPPDQVVNEIAGLKEKLVFFVDDNIVADHAAAKKLFRALIPLKIHWVGQGSLQAAQDLELVRLMKESGCLGILVGLESLDETNLKQLNKGWNTRERSLTESLQVFHDHGLSILGTFVLGMDNDTTESLWRVLEFAKSERLFAALFHPFTPYPGTALYERFVREGRIRIPNWWINPEYGYGKIIFNPKKIDADELEIMRLRMYRDFYGPATMLRRFLDTRTNSRDIWHIYLFAALNLPAYKEEARRFLLPLGEQQL